MIAIVGSTHDDILYFESIMGNKEKGVMFNRFETIVGTIFNQEVLLIHGISTSLLASSVITRLIDKQYISLVIVVGKCISISSKYKTGDLVISNRIIDVNVDLTSNANVSIAQIPGFKRDFNVQNDVLHYLEEGINKRTYVSSHIVSFLSSDNLSNETFNFLKENRSIFGSSDNYVVDATSAGVALACTLCDTPFISIKVVERQLDKPDNSEDYLQVLESYINLGKSVVSTIGDIGRNDILSMGGGH